MAADRPPVQLGAILKQAGVNPSNPSKEQILRLVQLAEAARRRRLRLRGWRR